MSTHPSPAPFLQTKTDGAAYAFFLLFGSHYLYLRQPGRQILFWLSCCTVVIGIVWAIIDLFLIPRYVDAYNAALTGAAPAAAPKPSPIPGIIGTAFALLIGAAICGYVMYRNANTPAPSQSRATGQATPAMQSVRYVPASPTRVAQSAPEKAQTVSRAPGTRREFITHDVDVSTARATGGSGGTAARAISSARATPGSPLDQRPVPTR
jgi:TM2 domain-containing membrane protein YozV